MMTNGFYHYCLVEEPFKSERFAVTLMSMSPHLWPGLEPYVRSSGHFGNLESSRVVLALGWLVETTRVAFKHFLGMPYATVPFHTRNMQEGMFLSGGDDSPAWKDAQLIAA